MQDDKPLEDGSHDELDNLDPTIRAQGAGEMSLLDEGVTMVGDTVATEELEASLDFDPSRYAGTSQYEVIDHDKPIGKGGFGTVWKVRDRKLGNILVMKRLHSQEDAGRQGITRFIQEARTIASLNHQNIITVYDIGKDDKGYFIIAEYVDGGSLQSHIDKKGPLSQKDAIDIAEQIGRALSYAHRRGVIHRDIKPANILLTRDGIPKVADFGLAKIGRASDLSVSGMAMGSLAFMPPEQRKDAKSADHRADIYALGKTLYHMLTGKIPETIRESEIPSTLRPALLKAIEPLPEDRYFTVEEFIRDLREGRGTEVTQETIKAGICPVCGWKNAPDADYCEGCGAGLVENCPVCARKKRVGLAFCAGCGTDIPKYKEHGERIQKISKYLEEKEYLKVQRESQKILSESPHSEQRKEVEGYLHNAKEKLGKVEQLSKNADELHEAERYDDEKPILTELATFLSEAETIELRARLEKLPSLIRERDCRNMLHRADELFRSRDYQGAMEVYTDAARLGAEKAMQMSEEARRLFIDQKLDEAEALRVTGDFEDALERLKNVLLVDPKHNEAKTRILTLEESRRVLGVRAVEMEDAYRKKDYKDTEALTTEILGLCPRHQKGQDSPVGDPRSPGAMFPSPGKSESLFSKRGICSGQGSVGPSNVAGPLERFRQEGKRFSRKGDRG